MIKLEFIVLDQRTLSYLIECNVALTISILVKSFHLEKKLCNKMVVMVTAIKAVFGKEHPELMELLPDQNKQ